MRKKKDKPPSITLTVEFNQTGYEELQENQKILLQTFIEGDMERFSHTLAKRAAMYMFHLRHPNFGQKEEENELESS